ncbi:MAG: sugar transferase [Bacteroidales bacterium]|nr:sugar transferase [Bacteroidales bacterium]
MILMENFHRYKAQADYLQYPIETLEYIEQQTYNDELLKHRLYNFKVQTLIGASVYRFIFDNTQAFLFETAIISNLHETNHLFNVNRSYNSVISLVKVNDFPDINKYLMAVNFRLFDKGFFIGVVEPKSIVKTNMFRKYPPGLNNLLYSLGYLLNDILQLTSFTRCLLIKLNNKERNFISKAEAFGRLCYCGFELQTERVIDNKLYFIAKKKQIPAHSKKNHSGLIIKLPRVVKNKKIKNIYKIRTMYPYSEYIQDYALKTKGLGLGGKINADFRVSKLGRFLRKYWLDELPMLLNLLRGDIKLVGVRPLSTHYFNLYTKDLQDLRTKTKPGLIPPFYVDFPETLDEIMLSELKYLNQYFEKPLITDIKYLFKALFNIFFKGYRSK